MRISDWSSDVCSSDLPPSHEESEQASEAPTDHIEQAPVAEQGRRDPVSITMSDGTQCKIDHGAVVIAAITSCTNTSNPTVMIAAALLAKKAVELGLARKPWVKTSLDRKSTRLNS